MQVFTCLWNLTMLGSSDLLFIDSYDTLKVMLALTQGLGGIYFENKNYGNSLCSNTTNATYIHENIFYDST